MSIRTFFFAKNQINADIVKRSIVKFKLRKMSKYHYFNCIKFAHWVEEQYYDEEKRVLAILLRKKDNGWINAHLDLRSEGDGFDELVKAITKNSFRVRNRIHKCAILSSGDFLWNDSSKRTACHLWSLLLPPPLSLSLSLP